MANYQWIHPSVSVDSSMMTQVVHLVLTSYWESQKRYEPVYEAVTMLQCNMVVRLDQNQISVQFPIIEYACIQATLGIDLFVGFAIRVSV